MCRHQNVCSPLALAIHSGVQDGLGPVTTGVPSAKATSLSLLTFNWRQTSASHPLSCKKLLIKPAQLPTSLECFKVIRSQELLFKQRRRLRLPQGDTGHASPGAHLTPPHPVQHMHQLTRNPDVNTAQGSLSQSVRGKKALFLSLN